MGGGSSEFHVYKIHGRRWRREGWVDGEERLEEERGVGLYGKGGRLQSFCGVWFFLFDYFLWREIHTVLRDCIVGGGNLSM